MNKFLMLVVLVLLVLASAVGLRNVTAAYQPVQVVGTGAPVPILPDTFAGTGAPVPILPDN